MYMYQKTVYLLCGFIGATLISVLECPSEEYLDSLTTCQQLKDISLQIIVHMTPADVVEKDQYKQFMDRYYYSGFII